MPFSNRLEELGQAVFQRNDFLKTSYREYSSKADQFPLIDLSLGSSDLLPPENVIKVMKDSLADLESSSYSLHTSTKPFREAAAIWCKKRLGVNVDPDREVLFLVGSQEGSAHLPLAITDPGDTGLILDPSYPSHMAGLVLANARIERLELAPEMNWEPSFDSLSNLQLDQLKIMTFGFPHNPTAQVGHQSLLDNAMTKGVRHNIVVAHDNPYLDLALDGEAPALLRSNGWREWGIEFFSLSKAWCLGGFRLGFAIGAAPIISALKRVKSGVDFNQSLALQKGAIEALLNTSEWPDKILGIYRERRNQTHEGLNRLGWQSQLPSMAMYLWMPLPAWAIARGWDDEKFASELLKKTGVAITPGSGFGDCGKDWLRLALVKPINELNLSISRIRPWWNENS